MRRPNSKVIDNEEAPFVEWADRHTCSDGVSRVALPGYQSLFMIVPLPGLDVGPAVRVSAAPDFNYFHHSAVRWVPIGQHHPNHFPMPTPLSKKISILKDQALAGKVHAAEEFESFVPHMYLDVVGQVTVGIGHGVLDAKAACLIAFKKADGSSASEGEITKEFNALTALASSQRDKPKSARYFEALTVLRIDEATAYNVAARDIGAKEKDIKRHFPDYDSYPGGVQEAILDMVFSMGIGKLLRSYPSFCKAVRERNWKAAAEHSNRRQVQVRRNTTVKDKLANAGKSVAQGDMAMAGRR